MPTKAKKPKKPIDREALEALELDPEAWPKFEKLVRSSALMGPQPHKTKVKTPRHGSK